VSEAVRDGYETAAASMQRPATGSALARRAWERSTRRDWLAAAAAGAAFGLGVSLHYAGRYWWDAGVTFGPLAFVWLRWGPLLAAVACVLSFSLALLEAYGDERRIHAGHYVLAVAGVAIVGMLVLDPALLFVRRALYAALGVSSPYAELHRPLPQQLKYGMLHGAPVVPIMLSLWTFVYLYGRSARRAAQLLGTAQVRLADAERRVIAEQLQSAQAMVDPAFLFDTLRLVEAKFEHDPEGADRLLDALIRFLRAALPSSADAGGTLGQQVRLARAWLDIESLRSGGRLSTQIVVPRALDDRPFGPLLLLPLIVNAVRHGSPPHADGKVTLRARTERDRLVVEIEHDGPGRIAAIRDGTGLRGVRERLVALYGSRARLTLEDRHPSGIRARLEIPEGGHP
jgi:hypothetical protein